MPKEIISKKERILQYFKDKRERESKERRKLFRNFKKRVERNKDEAVFNMSKISKYLANILQKFGEKKEKKISNFDKELAKINKETNDKKYIQMVIELLIGSGLLVTAIILLLIFLYKPNNDQINFVNTNNNNNKSLADKVREYKDNAIKRNQKIKPSHYKNNGGKNVYYNTVDEEFNIPEEKQSDIIKKFEKKNKISFSDIKTVRHYKSLASITKGVMNDNTTNNRNENKRNLTTPQSTPRRRRNPTTPPTVVINPTTPPRRRENQIETPPTVERKPNRNRNRITNRKPYETFNLDEDSTHLPSYIARLGNSVKSRIKKSRLKNLVLKNKTPPRNKQVKSRKSEEVLENEKTPPRNKQVKSRTSEEESPNNVAGFFENYKTSDRITKKGNQLNKDFVNETFLF